MIQLTDVKSVRRFVPDNDTYFTLLGYNPDTKKLATIQGEIRIGSGHQVINYRRVGERTGERMLCIGLPNTTHQSYLVPLFDSVYF